MIVPILGVKSRSRRSGRKSLADALLTKTQQRVLGVLFGQPEPSFYASELFRRPRAGHLHRGSEGQPHGVHGRRVFQARPEGKRVRDAGARAAETLGDWIGT